MQCPECGLNDVATDDGTIKPHPRPDTLQLCTGPTQQTPEPAAHEPKPARKTPAKKTPRKTKH
jgi:hypothetical protein